MYKYAQKHESIIEILKVFLGFSLVYLIFFAPVLFTAKLLAPGDGIIQSVPTFYSPRTLWIDSLYSGFPAAADPQMQHWYPLSIFFSLIPHSWNYFMVSAYVLASCFTYGYVNKVTNGHLPQSLGSAPRRPPLGGWDANASCADAGSRRFYGGVRVTGSKFAAVVSGLAYGMSGFMMAHLGHTAMVHSAAWIPLIIWSLEELRDKLTRQWFLIGCLAIACSILAGHPQISVYSFVLVTVYALVLGWNAIVGRWRYYQTFLAIAIFGIALGAIQIMPTAELASLGLRPDMTFEEFNSFSLPPIEAIKLIFPYILGASHPLPWLYDIPYFGSWNFVEMAGYVGITTLILALVGLIHFPNRAIAKFWAFTALFCFLLTLGDVTPLAWAIYHTPILNSFRVPARHLIEITFAFSVLAGLGLNSITRQLLSSKQLFKIIAYSSGFVTLLLIVVFLSKDTIIDEIKDEVGQEAARQYTLLPWSNLALGIPLLIFGTAAILLICLIQFPANKIVRRSLLLFMIFDLASFGWFCEWKYSPSVSIMQPTAVVQKYSQILARSHQRILPIRGIEGGWKEISPNISRLWGVPSAGGYGPLILSRVSKLLSMDVLGKVVTPDWNSKLNHSLDLMAIRYVTTPKDLSGIDYRDGDDKSYSAPKNDPDLQDKSRWNLVENMGEASIYQNLRAQPRVWLVPEVVKLQPDRVLSAIKSSNLPDGRTYEPSNMALVETDVNLKVDRFDRQATAEFSKLNETHLQIKTNSKSPAFLVLSDINYPGWHATIDGKTAPVRQTNYVLRGVELPKGAHTVEFVFKSIRFNFAVGISTAALFVCIYCCVCYLPKTRA